MGQRGEQGQHMPRAPSVLKRNRFAAHLPDTVATPPSPNLRSIG